MRILGIVFFLCAGLCIAYFLVILGYSGIGTSYCVIWLFFALLFIVMGLFARRSRSHEEELPRFLPVFVYTTFALWMTFFALIMGQVVRMSHRVSGVVPDYCIIMGARVYPDGISRTLMYRLDKAVEVFIERPDTTLISAGGQEPGDAVPEALAMYNYLSMKGIPGERMMLQPGATSTAALITASLRQIGADTIRRKIPKGPGDDTVWAEDYTPSVGIITSDYHLLRAVSVARKQGVGNPVPIAAPSDSVLYVHQCVRESLAYIKDYLMGRFEINEQSIPFDRNKGN